MPTQEERLDTVEFNLRQFKTETIKAYGDMAFEMTIIKGLTEDAVQRLAALSSTKVDAIETQLTEQKMLLTQILARLPEKP